MSQVQIRNREIVRMHMLAGLDGSRRMANHLAVFEDRFACGNRSERDFMSCGNRRLCNDAKVRKKRTRVQGNSGDSNVIRVAESDQRRPCCTYRVEARRQCLYPKTSSQSPYTRARCCNGDGKSRCSMHTILRRVLKRIIFCFAHRPKTKTRELVATEQEFAEAQL